MNPTLQHGPIGFEFYLTKRVCQIYFKLRKNRQANQASTGP
ncbi:MAG TPA: hypothetical protein VFY78_03085 [Gammaproteobacteria bacterium]|nr:hypothetical protein [Gammaproteobacteria bacterium]